MQIRMKRLGALAAPFLLTPAMLIGGATAASAAITTSCGPSYICSVREDMGNGFCSAVVVQSNAASLQDPYGSFATVGADDVNSGYTCNFFFQRNVNNTGWYKVYGFALPPTGANGYSPNEWNGAGYQARACLQFNWGSSLGAIHCSPAVSIA
jgi:hypothetical protein